ncbi:hypothetical protein RHMOL_Rhmol08G0243700 [Rhododendron molle]|uniref:Uncharacterized protein n=1 Tax=Rhododendron molle TaxID=49168 RepID=A0ACC0MSP0_RHOML|nr:hypothetical protein RHMOL_Rhmol08G0243700 [Rhododendron molle]
MAMMQSISNDIEMPKNLQGSILLDQTYAVPSTDSTLEFYDLDLPDSFGELLTCCILFVLLEHVYNRVSHFVQAMFLIENDNGIKAQGERWVLTVALINETNFALSEPTGFPDPYVVFTCNGRRRTSSVKLQSNGIDNHGFVEDKNSDSGPEIPNCKRAAGRRWKMKLLLEMFEAGDVQYKVMGNFCCQGDVTMAWEHVKPDVSDSSILLMQVYVRYQFESSVLPARNSCKCDIYVGVMWLKSTKFEQRIRRNIIEKFTHRLKHILELVEREILLANGSILRNELLQDVLHLWRNSFKVFSYIVTEGFVDIVPAS